MAPAVVVAAPWPPVAGDGEPARRVRLDVIDFAVVGADVAELMEALAVADLDGAPGAAGEEAPPHAHVDDPVGRVEHHSLDPRLVEPAHQAAGRDDRAV